MSGQATACTAVGSMCGTPGGHTAQCPPACAAAATQRTQIGMHTAQSGATGQHPSITPNDLDGQPSRLSVAANSSGLDAQSSRTPVRAACSAPGAQPHQRAVLFIRSGLYRQPPRTQCPQAQCIVVARGITHTAPHNAVTPHARGLGLQLPRNARTIPHPVPRQHALPSPVCVPHTGRVCAADVQAHGIVWAKVMGMHVACVVPQGCGQGHVVGGRASR